YPFLIDGGVVVESSTLKRNVVRGGRLFNKKKPFDYQVPELKSEAQMVEGYHIFLGSFGYNHYGHFITEQAGMLYPCILDQFSDAGIVFHGNLPGHVGSIKSSFDDFPDYIKKFLDFVGIASERFKFYSDPVVLEKVVFCSPTFVLDNYVNKF